MQCEAFVNTTYHACQQYIRRRKLALQRQILYFVSTAQRDFWTTIRTGGPPALGNWGAKQEL
jgi:hypothetical protein